MHFSFLIFPPFLRLTPRITNRAEEARLVQEGRQQGKRRDGSRGIKWPTVHHQIHPTICLFLFNLNHKKEAKKLFVNVT